VPGEFLVRRVASSAGGDDLHQLDLVELVLADHAAGVATVGAGFGAETRRVADELERQRPAARISLRTMLVTGTSAVGIRYSGSASGRRILNRSSSNFGSCPVPRRLAALTR
jgi:hypothetical protein